MEKDFIASGAGITAVMLTVQLGAEKKRKGRYKKNMARTNYQRGADKERRIINFFKARFPDCIAFRSAGSHSPIDVVIIHPVTGEIRLIQSKLGHLPYKEREKIKQEGLKLNGPYQVLFELWDDEHSYTA